MIWEVALIIYKRNAAYPYGMFLYKSVFNLQETFGAISEANKLLYAYRFRKNWHFKAYSKCNLKKNR
jgi:hypothetical protein